MINRINGDLNLLNTQNLKLEEKKNESSSFMSLMEDKLQEVNSLQKNSDNLIEDFALGKTDNIHQVMVAGEKAEIAMNLTLSIQNKVIDAYKEIMRIQV